MTLDEIASDIVCAVLKCQTSGDAEEIVRKAITAAALDMREEDEALPQQETCDNGEDLDS